MKIKSKCCNCNKVIFKPENEMKRAKRHYCSQKCHYIDRKKYLKGSGNPRWNGGRRIEPSGYILVYKPEHPYAQIRGYVMEHRLVMEKKLRRYLKPSEVVHHKNEIKHDNRSSNLEIVTKRKHRLIHNPKANHHPNKATCPVCKKMFRISPNRLKRAKTKCTCSVRCKGLYTTMLFNQSHKSPY